MAYKLPRLFTVAIALSFLSGCTGLQQDFERNLNFMFGQQPKLAEPMAVDDVNAQMMQNFSNSDVQVFSLDGPAPVLPYDTMPSQFEGVPYAPGSGIIVYPLDNSSSLHRGTIPMESHSGLQQRGGQQNSGFIGATKATPSRDGQDRIYYSHGQTRLTGDNRRLVRNIASQNSGQSIRVQGHASARAEVGDPVERSIVNLKTSMDRAFRVSSELIRTGVAPTNIETKIYGDSRPSVPMDGRDAEAASRRVDILTGTQPQSQPAMPMVGTPYVSVGSSFALPAYAQISRPLAIAPQAPRTLPNYGR